MTILLKAVPHDKIDLADLKGYDAALRKRLSRNGLNGTAIIGGYEIVYRAQSKTWVLHINLVVIGGTNEAIRTFASTFYSFDIAKPVVVQQLKSEDRPTHLSYILKFTTYHRPFAQHGCRKTAAVSLNSREHCAVVAWMAQWKFQDFMFLFNARREGAIIVSGPRSTLSF